MEEDRFIREPEVKRITGLSRTTRWRLERKGEFPPRRQLSENAVGWLESEIRVWIASRTASSAPLKAAVPLSANRGHYLDGGSARDKRSLKAVHPLLTETGERLVDLGAIGQTANMASIDVAAELPVATTDHASHVERAAALVRAGGLDARELRFCLSIGGVTSLSQRQRDKLGKIEKAAKVRARHHTGGSAS